MRRATILVGLLLAGCGGDATSSDQPATTAGTTASKELTPRQQAVRFSECMRESGVADFPDPNADNDYDYGVSVSAEAFTKAVTTCKRFQPPGTLSADRTPEEQSGALTFAECIRSNGVKDFPDPVDGEPVINTYKIPSANRPGGMTILNAAIDKCRNLGPQP